MKRRNPRFGSPGIAQEIAHAFAIDIDKDVVWTIRRAYLDYVLIWNAIGLKRKLDEFRLYYNESRVHQSLRGSTPSESSANPPPARAVLDHYVWRQHCRSLFQLPIAAKL